MSEQKFQFHELSGKGKCQMCKDIKKQINDYKTLCQKGEVDYTSPFIHTFAANYKFYIRQHTFDFGDIRCPSC